MASASLSAARESVPLCPYRVEVASASSIFNRARSAQFCAPACTETEKELHVHGAYLDSAPRIPLPPAWLCLALQRTSTSSWSPTRVGHMDMRRVITHEHTTCPSPATGQSR